MPIERKLQIKIPPGVDTGSQLRITGEGEPGLQGGPPGDLYVVVRVEEHDFFKRDGTSLVCELPVSLTQAALGASLEVPDPRRRQGQGAGAGGHAAGRHLPPARPRRAAPGARGRGDLHVVVRVVVPTKLSGEQKRLLKELDKTLPTPELREKDRSFIDKMKDILS